MPSRGVRIVHRRRVHLHHHRTTLPTLVNSSICTKVPGGGEVGAGRGRRRRGMVRGPRGAPNGGGEVTGGGDGEVTTSGSRAARW